MNSRFNFLTLLLWVAQFGFSILFPLCFFLILGSWLQQRYDLGLWVVLVMGVLGFLTSVSTTRSCIRSLRKAADACGEQKKPPVAFNDHD